tara:strand:- start:579 stop:1052 length:474 start_codon:yes stop_codon:yes gene_type:complete
MNNWKSFYDFEKAKQAVKKEQAQKRLLFFGVFALSLMLMSLILAVVSSAALAKVLFGSLFALLGIAAAIAHVVFYYWVIAAVFQDEGISGGLVFLFLCVITCYLYYIYYAFVNCTPLVAVLSSFGALLAKSLAAAAVYTYTGGAFTIPLFGMQIIPV